MGHYLEEQQWRNYKLVWYKYRYYAPKKWLRQHFRKCEIEICIEAAKLGNFDLQPQTNEILNK
jgi:hypothetical protein